MNKYEMMTPEERRKLGIVAVRDELRGRMYMTKDQAAKWKLSKEKQEKKRSLRKTMRKAKGGLVKKK